MKALKLAAALHALGLFVLSPAFGGTSGSSTMTFNIQSINEIAVTGSPSLTVSSATAGQEPNEATAGSSTYAISTNCTGKKLTAALGSAMPSNTTLKASAAAPSGGGSSQGYVTLGTSAATLVTGMGHAAESSLSISYKLGCTAGAGVISSSSKSVVFTISD